MMEFKGAPKWHPSPSSQFQDGQVEISCGAGVRSRNKSRSREIAWKASEEVQLRYDGRYG